MTVSMNPYQTLTAVVTRRFSLLLSAFILLLIGVGTLGAQQGGGGSPGPGSGTDLDEVFGGEEGSSTFSSGSEQQTRPIERSVDAASYRVGPLDKLLISASGLSSSLPAVIGYDNRLVLPRGLTPVDVTGLTLLTLQQKLDSIFSARSGGYGDISLSLVEPRTIYIRVSGDVLAPGRYILTAADRISTAIDLANRIPEELAQLDDQFTDLTKKSIIGERSGYGARNLGAGVSGGKHARNIIVRHADGTIDRVDLVRYYALGQTGDNPTLREGDHIFVQYSDPFGAAVSIVGAVNNPSVGIPWREGDRLSFLLGIAAGLREDAVASDAHIIRQREEGDVEIPIDLGDSLSVAAFELMPGDQVIVPIRKHPVGDRIGVVTVEGEVVRPQAYPIVPGKTTLSEVINRAGGFTQFASLNGAYIRRPTDPLAMRPEQLVLDPKSGISTSELALEDTLRYMFDQQVQQNQVSADFVSIFRDGNTARDVTLQNGDAIIVPRELGQVYVMGRVEHPGWVQYVPGKLLEYYIDKAGGYTTAAAPERVAVEKFGTGVWNGVCCTEIESGDRIYVPGERDTPARTALEQASTVLAIAASTLLIANTMIDIFNKIFPDEN